jgi:DnaJ-class molecular chaperone
MKAYYATLFLQENATITEVKISYRKLVKKFHPDKNLGSDEYIQEFRKIQEAYEKIIENQETIRKGENNSNNEGYKNTFNQKKSTFEEDIEALLKKVKIVKKRTRWY